MERKDMYTWIIIAVVAIAAIAFIYFQNAGSSAQSGPINVGFAVSSNHSSTLLYPYQRVFVPVQITNLGNSYIKSLGVGIFINGNLSTIYNVSIPVGQSLTLNFSKQFSNPGTFNVTFVADPSNLYVLQNRSQSRAQFQVVVQKAQTAAPYSTLPSNTTWQKESYTSVGGYVYYSIFRATYGLSSFQTSLLPTVNGFFNPLINLTYSYINNMSSAEGIYKNASAYSLWIQGSLSGNSTNIWAKGLKLNATNQTVNGQSVAVITLNHNTTLCSWYSGGWLKNLAYEGNQSCTVPLTGTFEQSAPAAGFLPAINNSKLLANFSESSKIGQGYGQLLLVNNSAVYEASTPNTNPSYLCYGVITSQDNRSYCTTYQFPINSNTIGPLSLISTTSFVGQQNLSVITLVNTSFVPYEASANIDLLSRFNASGATQPFTEGINNTCSLNASLSCYDPSLYNGNLTLRFYNKLNQTSFKVDTMACTEAGSSIYSNLSLTIPALTYLNVTVPCYDNGKAVLGVPLGLSLKLNMNYTVTGGSFKALGEAYLV